MNTSRAASQRRRLLPLLAALILALAACGGEIQTPGEALRLQGNRNLPTAWVGEPYDEPIRATGGLRPFTFRLEDGQLPAGLELQGGSVRGTPTETGQFEFTVAVSDANLSSTFEYYTLQVSERPAPQVVVDAPATEVREPVTIGLGLRDAHRVRAASVQLTWDPAAFTLAPENAVRSLGNTAIFTDTSRAGEGVLQVDFASLGAAWNGTANVAQVTLVPTEPARLRTQLTARIIDDLGNEHMDGDTPGEAAGSPADGEDEPDGDGPAEEPANDGEPGSGDQDPETAEAEAEESRPEEAE